MIQSRMQEAGTFSPLAAGIYFSHHLGIASEGLKTDHLVGECDGLMAWRFRQWVEDVRSF